MKKIKTLVFPYVRSYRWRSIFFKYFITFLLAIAIPFTTLTITIFSYVTGNYRKDIQSSLKSSVASYTYSLENIIHNVDTNIDMISVNNYVLTYLISAGKDTSDLYFFNLAQRVSELFTQFLISNEYIHSIQLYNKTNGELISFGENKNYNYMHLFDTYFQKDSPNCTLSHNFVDNKTPIKTITIYREILLSSESIGVMAVNLNAEKMLATLVRQSADSIKNIEFFTEDGALLYRYDDYEPTSDAPEELQSVSESINIVTSSTSEYRLTTKLKNLPYLLYVTCPNNNSSLLHLWIMELFCILIMLAISFVLAYKLSIYFYNSLAGILTIIENSSHSNSTKTAKDEINFLSSSILEILHKNEQIEQELLEKTLSFQRSQMQALQMQINPHFIFNTLQLASTMTISIAKKDTPVSKMLSMLAELIHAVYQIDDYLIPLQQELQYAKNYLEIQSMRYNNSFSVEWDIQEDALSYHVIKFSIQPILENAITHGLMPLDCKGTIRISTSLENEQLCIRIADNGVGIPTEKLTAIRTSLKTDELSTGKGIGLRNTQQRIQNVFGTEYGLTVDSGNFGTTVTIYNPCI